MQLRIICKFLVTDVCSLILSETGWEYGVKRMGPRTEPWGTPYFKGKGKEFKSPTETDCVLLVR